jgi:hypothetical protein
MRIALTLCVVLLGIKLGLELADSPLRDRLQERNETIQRQIDAM